jgi:hypothetical protein
MDPTVPDQAHWFSYKTFRENKNIRNTHYTAIESQSFHTIVTEQEGWEGKKGKNGR